MLKIIKALVFYVLSVGAVFSAEHNVSENAKTVSFGPSLLPHMAIYDLQLESATGDSGMVGLTGRIAYEFSGSNCAGYNTLFRIVTRSELADMAMRLSDQQISNFETGDAREFVFSSKTIIDEEVVEEKKGVAKIESDTNMVVKMDLPEQSVYHLKPALFPTIHTQEIIQHALDGKHFYQTTLYDGVQGVDENVEVTVVIGNKTTAKEDSETKLMGGLGKQPYWPVTISYFEDEENPDGLPSYRTQFLLYENGVTRDLLMDYRNFVVRGKIKKFQILPQSKDAQEKICQ